MWGRANAAMKKKKLLVVGLACAVAAVFAVGVRGDAAEEIKRLAELMGWKAGTAVADIGAGDGKYTFAAVERVGAAGKVYATEIDAKKLAELKEEVARRKLANVIVVDEFAGGGLRRDFSEARLPSPDQAGGVRCEPRAVVEGGRAADDY